MPVHCENFGSASNRYRRMPVKRFHETWSFILCISFMTVNDMTRFHETWSVPFISFMIVNDIRLINSMSIIETL